MQGPYATNEKLKNATKLFEGQIHGSGVSSGLTPLHMNMTGTWDADVPSTAKHVYRYLTEISITWRWGALCIHYPPLQCVEKQSISREQHMCKGLTTNCCFHGDKPCSLLFAESVALASDGSLWMLDKYGYVWRAPEDGKGSYALEKEPLAQLGPGRPLGFDFDEQGNLIVCNSGSVSPPLRATIFLNTLMWRDTRPRLSWQLGSQLTPGLRLRLAEQRFTMPSAQ